jgi:hypothetical protein
VRDTTETVKKGITNGIDTAQGIGENTKKGGEYGVGERQGGSRHSQRET